MTALEGWVWLARVKRTQGRKGEVFAEILTDFPEKFSERRRLWLLPAPAGFDLGESQTSTGPQVREVELRHHWLHKGGVVLHFGGVDSISAAEQLVGCIVAIPRAERTSLGADEIYISDLIGCELVNLSGPQPVTVGRIENVDRGAGPVAMLVVRGNSRFHAADDQRPRDDEILIPFAKDYLRLVDVNQKRVEMALPEGLADLNS